MLEDVISKLGSERVNPFTPKFRKFISDIVRIGSKIILHLCKSSIKFPSYEKPNSS